MFIPPPLRRCGYNEFFVQTWLKLRKGTDYRQIRSHNPNNMKWDTAPLLLQSPWYSGGCKAALSVEKTALILCAENVNITCRYLNCGSEGSSAEDKPQQQYSVMQKLGKTLINCYLFPSWAYCKWYSWSPEDECFWFALEIIIKCLLSGRLLCWPSELMLQKHTVAMGIEH